MPPEPLVDIEGPRGAPRPAATPVNPAPSTAAITQERSGNGPLTAGFAVGVLLLGFLAGALAFWLGTLGGSTAAEQSARPLVWGLEDAGLGVARGAAAVALAATVMAVAVAGRSLTRSGIAGLLAGALVGLDPALLGYGRLAVPTALTVAGLAVALACFAASQSWVPWLGGVALAFAAATDPRALAWGPVLLAFTVLRGNIYASPRHLGIATTQALLIPLLGAVLHRVLDGTWDSVPACFAPGAWPMLSLQALVLPGDELALVPNPVTWFAGLGALVFLGLGGVGLGATRFRLARANGRVQARLTSPFPAVMGRGIWLLLLAVTLPVPQAWVLVFALALALGVQDLGEDAPGFGLTLAIALLLFAVVVLLRCWQAIAGSGGDAGVADALGLVPWSVGVEC